MSTFDPMAAAIDWLDAYRAGSFCIVDQYASDAVIECACGDMKVLRGPEAITEYWRHRFDQKPAGQLVELQPAGDGVFLSYRAAGELVRAHLYFDLDGKITRSVCGPILDIFAVA
jgi:ketosteroid isomerase-like protein